MQSLLRLGFGLAASSSLLLNLSAWAQEDNQSEEETEGTGVEEVLIVTAQRQNENIQDVPIAVSALSAEMLEDQQVITPSDLQMNAPSVSYTATNFGGSSFSIRGVGRIVLGRSGEPGVSAHLNEIPLDLNLNTMEFFDMERVEVLRGPQGTLFGRNATGGVINFVSAQPVFDERLSEISIETGSYNHRRLKGMFNIGLGENLALRVAGYNLQRDGFTENLAARERDESGNPIPNIDDSIDGRDVTAFRATLRWEPRDDLTAWFMWGEFEEDDDRARITNMVCERNDLPTTGCKPNGYGLETPHLGASTGGLFGSGVGAIPLGASGEAGSLYKYPRPQLDNLRQVHTDFDPIFKSDERLYAFGVEYRFADYTAGLTGAWTGTEGLSQQDYTMDVGVRLNPTPFNPSGRWPVSRPSGRFGEDWISGGCNVFNGSVGAIGGCALEGIDDSVLFSYDQASGQRETWVLEASLRSNFSGRMNFLAGAIASDRRASSDYYVISNSLDLVSRYGSPLLGLPPLYPGMFINSTSPLNPSQRASSSIFGEGYLDISPQSKLTVGLRINYDEIAASDTSVLFNAWNHVPVLFFSVYDGIHTLVAQLTGVPKALLPREIALARAMQLGLLDPNHLMNINAASGVFWSRTPNLLLGPLGSGPAEKDLVMYYGVTEAEFEAATRTGAYSAARVALSNLVPLAPTFRETRNLTGSPADAEFTKTTGRIVFDHQLADGTLLYAAYSRGYKPGGLNSAIPPAFADVSSYTFEPESVNAYEFGVKTRLLDGQMTLNSALFRYDYVGLQSTRIRNNSNLIENIDASIAGLELEGIFSPSGMPNLNFDFAYSFLNTSVQDTMSVDPLNRVGGVDGWVLLNNIDPGSLTATNFIARESQISNELVAQALANRRALDIRNGATIVSVSYPENSNGVSIPVYWSRAFLASVGVETSDGNPLDLDGRTLPNSPEHSLSLGASYTQPVGLLNGHLTYRLDYYIQSETYAREFNTQGDEIDGWGQINASLIYESGDGRLGVQFWVRNVTDKENVTGHYVTSDTSGFFRNYFLTEPKIIGASFRYRTGGN